MSWKLGMCQGFTRPITCIQGINTAREHTHTHSCFNGSITRSLSLISSLFEKTAGGSFLLHFSSTVGSSHRAPALQRLLFSNRVRTAAKKLLLLGSSVDGTANSLPASWGQGLLTLDSSSLSVFIYLGYWKIWIQVHSASKLLPPVTLHWTELVIYMHTHTYIYIPLWITLPEKALCQK